MATKVICWDTCVMISHIGGDPEKPEREIAIQSAARALEEGKHHLIVSTIMYPEVLETTMSPNAIQTFERFIQNREVIDILAVDTAVAKKSQSLRNRIDKLTTPDAIHIATALIGRADVFHTFDKFLLRLDRKDEVDGLRIVRCATPDRVH